MVKKPAPYLADILAAIDRIRDAMGDLPLDAFEADWKARWLVERGVEIVSEASRRLPDDFKARHSEIPWKKVASIGNILRHEYAGISAPVLWSLVRDNLAPLEKVCRDELDREGRTKHSIV